MAEPGVKGTLEGQARGEPAHVRQRAAEAVLHELVDGLLAEGALGLLERSEVSASLPPGTAAPALPLAEGERYLHLPLGQCGQVLLMRVRPQPSLQPYRLSRPPVVATGAGTAWEALDAGGLLRRLAGALPASEQAEALPGLASLLEALEDSVARGALALGAEGALSEPLTPGRSPTLVDWERLASLRDRPFHPTARAKRGWSLEDARRYGPESGQAFELAWVAVRREALLSSPEACSVEPSSVLLSAEEQARVAQALREVDPAGSGYVALPVHPWQSTHVLPRLFAEELAARTCTPLACTAGRYTATASLRTLAPASGPGAHLKLPLGIESLGALRTLPPRYLHNGSLAQALLGQLRERDTALGRRLHLCEERRWWALREPTGDLFADKPSHLACQVRELPAALTQEPGTRLVPMAALAVVTAEGRAPGLELLLREHGGGPQALLEELAEVLVDTALRCFRFGLMPELHGQNVLLVVRAGRVEGVLLRDHDTLRLHAPWLRAHGLPVPGYLLKPNTPNTLTLGTPEELLAYFQTLAVQVNLYAVAEALSRSHGLPLSTAWHTLRRCTLAVLERLEEGPVPVRAVLERELLESAQWPFKQVLQPLLRRAGLAGTGMPSALGTTRNPLAARYSPAGGSA